MQGSGRAGTTNDLSPRIGLSPRLDRGLSCVERCKKGPRLREEDHLEAFMIGRTNQLAQLLDAIKARFSGASKRSVLFVTGEAGIGKSTLLDALRTRLAS